MKAIIIFLLLISSLSANLTITRDIQKINNFELSYMYDETNKLSIDKIANYKFTNTINSQYTFGYISGTTWFKVSITNKSMNDNFVLYYTEPFSETLNLYYKENDKYVKSEAGLDIRINKRDIFDSNPVFNLNLKSKKTRTYYIQAHTEFSQMGEFIIEDKDSYLSKTKVLSTALYMFYFGSLLIVIFLNYFLFFATKKKIYFYYASYILFYTAWMVLFVGYDVYLDIVVYHKEMHSFAAIFMIFFILFSRSFLEIKSSFPILNKFLLSLILALAILVPLVIIDVNPWLEIINFLATLTFITLIASSVFAWKKGNSNAKYYLFIMLLYIASLALTSSVLTGTLQNNDFSRYVFLYVSYIEIIFFTLILANIHNKVQVQANTDSLTGLFNRRHFIELANRDLKLSKKYSHNLCLLLLDIDYFKKINDTYGHKTGDIVLVEISNILSELSRNEDIVARYGGEEFIILLSNTSLKDASIIAHNIKRKVEKTIIILDSKKLSLTLSIGISQFKQELEVSIEDLIDEADKKLYKAKEAGRNFVCSI